MSQKHTLLVKARIRMKFSFHPVNHLARPAVKAGFMQLSG
jgi:hypothetical protein